MPLLKSARLPWNDHQDQEEARIVDNSQHEGPEQMQRFGSAEAILDVIYQVRQSLTQLLESVHLKPTKGRETARSLQIDRNLVWRMTRIIKAEDILATISDIPTSQQVEKICGACEGLGAPEAKVSALRQAIAVFEQVVEECAGNREYFEAMVSGLQVDDVTQRQESTRKITFLGNLSLWGVQARVNFKTMIYVPGASSDIIDCIRVAGLVDFKRSRQRSWPIHRVAAYDDAGSIISIKTAPILPDENLPPGLPLLKPFCSGTQLDIVPVERHYGTRYDLAPGPFGNQGTLTYVFADKLTHAHEVYRTTDRGDDRYMASMNDLVTPSEYVVHDIFLHKSFKIDAAPEVLLLDRLSTARGYQHNDVEKDRLPLSTRILNVSAGPASSAITQYPEYSKMIQFILDREGLDADELRGYRFTMTYPPVPSAVVMRVALSERPADQ